MRNRSTSVLLVGTVAVAVLVGNGSADGTIVIIIGILVVAMLFRSRRGLGSGGPWRGGPWGGGPWASRGPQGTGWPGSGQAARRVPRVPVPPTRPRRRPLGET